jgi:hypothetical protein
MDRVATRGWSGPKITRVRENNTITANVGKAQQLGLGISGSRERKDRKNEGSNANKQ